MKRDATKVQPRKLKLNFTMKKVSKKVPSVKNGDNVEYISLNGDMQKKIKGGNLIAGSSSTDRVCQGGCGSTRAYTTR